MSLQDFEQLKKLGDGAFGNVFKVRRTSDGQIYALKKVRLGPLKPKEKENALNEVRIMASYNHPNIIAFKEAFIDEASNTLCIVMELAEGGDILKRIESHKQHRTRYLEKDIWDALIQTTRGLKALHDLKILHRDLKCANIFIGEDGTYKLGDLNVSKVNKGGMASTQTGTPYYASPEVWKDQPYNSSSDIWSLGCVIYEMAALNPPFMGNDMKALYNRIIRGVYPNIPPNYSQDLSNVIKAMLQVNPSQRPSCAQILEMPYVLRHINQAPVDEEVHENPDLLGTIKFEPNFHRLNNKLPEANYEKKERVLSARPIAEEEEETAPKPRVISSAKGPRPMPNEAQKKIEASRNPSQPSLNQQVPESRAVQGANYRPAVPANIPIPQPKAKVQNPNIPPKPVVQNPNVPYKPVIQSPNIPPKPAAQNLIIPPYKPPANQNPNIPPPKPANQNPNIPPPKPVYQGPNIQPAKAPAQSPNYQPSRPVPNNPPPQAKIVQNYQPKPQQNIPPQRVDPRNNAKPDSRGGQREENKQQKPGQPRNLSVPNVPVSKVGVSDLQTPKQSQSPDYKNQLKAQYDKVPSAINPKNAPPPKYQAVKPVWWG